MHVKTRQVVFLGVLAAMVTILIVLASVLETNTLFFLGAAAYLVGIGIREYGLKMGFAFFVACILLGLLLSPNKWYVITYAGLSFYIFGNEASYGFLMKKVGHVTIWIHYGIKFILFNLLFIPGVMLAPKLLFTGSMNTTVLIGLLIGGQIGWFLYDKAYEYVQITIWGKFRKRIGFSKE